jgi:hypothetical protein
MSDTIKAELDSRSANVPLTLEQFEAWEEQYKKDRPEMYAARVANGDIERQRVLCGGKPKADPAVKSVEELTKPELVTLAKEKGVELTGSETKAELVEKLK